MYNSVLLFSGGIDSTFILTSLIKEKLNPLCVLVDYGQPHKVELDRAKNICNHLGVQYLTFHLPSINKINDVVFSARNMMLISLGCMVANSKNIKLLYVGCNKSDFERFDDCRIEFLSVMKKGCEAYGVTLEYPLIYKEKKDIVSLLKTTDTDLYNMTWTCYSPLLVGGTFVQCGECYSCKGVKVAENV